MPDDTPNLPAARSNSNLAFDVGDGLPPSLRLLLDANAYERVKAMAGMMSRAEGITPRHLLGKPEACHAVINISLDAKLSPHFVARHTYQTPGGQIGYDGALVQSVLEQSGRFVGSPEFEYRGDWTALTGKFEKVRGNSGGEYIRPTWTAQDAIGLGIIVRWLVRGEKVARVWPGENDPFWLTQCFPLNSPLWANDPKTQIAYLAIRRFANQTSPGILGAAGAPIVDDDAIDARDMIDVTPPPRPQRETVETVEPREPADTIEGKRETLNFWGMTREGEEVGFVTIADAADWLVAEIDKAPDDKTLDAVRDDNQQLIDKAASRTKGRINQAIARRRRELEPNTKIPEDVTPGAKEADRQTHDGIARTEAAAVTAGRDRQSDPPSGDSERQQAPAKPARPQAAAVTGQGSSPPANPAAATPGGAFQPRKIEVPWRSGQPDLRTWMLLFHNAAKQCDLEAMKDLVHLNEMEITAFRGTYAEGNEYRTQFEAMLEAHWKRVTLPR